MTTPPAPPREGTFINRVGRESHHDKVRSRVEPAQEPAIQRKSRGKDGQSRGNRMSEDLMLGPV